MKGAFTGSEMSNKIIPARRLSLTAGKTQNGGKPVLRARRVHSEEQISTLSPEKSIKQADQPKKVSMVKYNNMGQSCPVIFSLINLIGNLLIVIVQYD